MSIKRSPLILVVAGIAVSILNFATFGAEDIQSVLGHFQQVCDTIMLTEKSRLESIAHAPAAQLGEWEGIKDLLTYGMRDRVKSLYWYALPDGSYYTSEKDKVSANLKSRTYFPTLVGGEAVVGELIVGKTSGLASTVVAVPIKRDGQVTGVLGVSIFLDEMTDEVISEMTIPRGMVCFSLGPDGRTALDTSDKALIWGNAQQQERFPSFQKAVDE